MKATETDSHRVKHNRTSKHYQIPGDKEKHIWPNYGQGELFFHASKHN